MYVNLSYQLFLSNANYLQATISFYVIDNIWGIRSFFWYVVNCWCYWEILRFVSDLFSSCFLCYVESIRELRTEEKKARITLDSNFIFWVYDYFVVIMFS